MNSLKDFVCLQSGFVFRKTSYFYKVFKEDFNFSTLLEDLRHDHNRMLYEYYHKNNIYSSKPIYALYETYRTDKKNFDSFISLIDAIREVFEYTNIHDWIKMQFANNYTSYSTKVVFEKFLKTLANKENNMVLNTPSLPLTLRLNRSNEATKTTELNNFLNNFNNYKQSIYYTSNRFITQVVEENMLDEFMELIFISDKREF